MQLDKVTLERDQLQLQMKDLSSSDSLKNDLALVQQEKGKLQTALN